ncbi:MAG: MDR/zinc-dependent alcohol dehydrogenase-like family protein [Thermodesulfobacteriota bacterium]
MQAVVLDNTGYRLENRPVQDVGQGEVLVRTLLAGICTTDLELFRGMYDFAGVPGHEFVGTVERDDKGDLLGKRVVADINCGCGLCAHCLLGEYRHCPARSVIGIRSRDGAFAEYCSVPRENLYVVPEQLENRQAVFAEPLAAALKIPEQVHIGSQDEIAVLGDGKLGLLITFALSLYSQNVVLRGHHQDKLDIAAGQGLQVQNTSCGSGSGDANPDSNRFDLVVDATASPSGLQEAIDIARPQGTVVLKTTLLETPSLDTAGIAVKELRIQGSRCGNIGWALYNLSKGRISVEPLIEAVYPFSGFEQAMQHASEKGARKILLDFHV